MWRGLKLFAVITIPASAVNAGLKCKQNKQQKILIYTQITKKKNEEKEEKFKFCTYGVHLRLRKRTPSTLKFKK